MQHGTSDAAADRELKGRHQSMWGMGDYPSMARDFLLPLGERLVEAAGVAAGQTVLDVAAGTGNAAIAAAGRGATVVASDLTPSLFEDGRARAREAGAELEWREADAEQLPFEDASFDVVMSCIGAMFAPRHERVADELVRVCRPGGTIAMINWTPEGTIGDLFRTMGPFMPAPPPGATPPPQWGSEEHVRALLGACVNDLQLTRETLPVEIFEQPLDLREYFKRNYGPTIVAYANAADDPGRTAQLDVAFAELCERNNRASSGERARFGFEYLVVVATRV